MERNKRDTPGQFTAMKTMKLYDRVERINNELEALGLGADAPLKVEDLTAFDQYHYLGTSAVDHAIEALGIDASSCVLEIGSGIGGPARYVAQRTGAHVSALELQSDLHRTAERLTRRCGLSGRISQRCGNILDGVPEGSPFDAILSFLVFLHIPERDRLFDVCRRSLKQDRSMFIEDFVLRQVPSVDERHALKIKVLCPYLPDAETYRSHLREAGFAVERFEDMTESWKDFTAERLHAFRANRSRNLTIHGEAITDGLDDFYSTVAGLFERGVLGGARILARRTRA
jgi:cyclopropane fatty-acyl-phospholipid synthase-like methyltransferase